MRILKKQKNFWQYHHSTHVHQKPQAYEVRFLRHGVRETKFCAILDQFLPFYALKNPEDLNFVKIEKEFGDVIILHMCNKNRNHMMYTSSDMECNRHSNLSFLAIFSHFSSTINPEN